MFYEGLHNHVHSNHKNFQYDKTRILITKRYASNDYSLLWNDLALWGTSFMNKEFVRYNRVRIFDVIPEELDQIALENESFDTNSKGVHCKDIGRYSFEVEGKKWILDIIFPSSYSRNLNEELHKEYTQGNRGVRSSWRYDIFDSSMIEFLMELINGIPKDERDFITTVRTIMANFSSENYSTALIEGRWNGKYEGGKAPNEWEYTAEIFRTRKLTNEPIRYGQCWIFAECMTAAMRFLGIPTRTIHAKNSHINISVNYAIDLYGYSSSDKKDEDDDAYYKKIEDIHKFLINDDKDEDELSSQVFVKKDSMWNFHYWNEIYVPRDDIFSWECLDSCPIIYSKDSPLSNKKILGPCKVNNIKIGLDRKYDFTYLSSAVNSPFRVWTKSFIVVDDEPVFMSFVHSIVFPFFPNHSIISRKKSLSLSEKKVILQTRVNKTNDSDNILDVTEEYKMQFESINRLIYKNHPAMFVFMSGRIYVNYDENNENEYVVQQVGLNSRGIPIFATKTKCKLSEIVVIPVTQNLNFLSTLIHRENETWPQLIEIKN